jgi:hypothetical protein
MTPTPPDQDQIPPPPRFATDTEIDPAHEVDVDLGEGEQLLDRHTVPEGVEYLGDYASLELYFRSQLEPEVSRGCAWILDHLDYQAIQKRWESDGSRLVCESGCVYRISAPDPDPAGPWMPTRGV